MSNRRQTPQSGAGQRAGHWVARAVIALVAVLGVVAMHGLTMNHDAAMAGVDALHSSSDSLAAPGSGDPAAKADALTMGSPITDLPSTVPTGAATHTARVMLLSAAHSTQPMAAACVAFLTGLLLLLVAGRELSKFRRGALASLLRHGVAWLATSVEPLRPDLAELSVLRT